MKVKELSEKLKEYNPNADITTPMSEDITLSYIHKDQDDNNYTKKTTKLVFIEPMDSCPTCIHEYNDVGIMMCSYYGKPCRMVDECYQFEEFYE